MKYGIGLLLCLFLYESTSQTTCSGQFSTQEEIDNFSTNFPSCTTIFESLSITGSDITNLEGLSQLTEVTGLINISGGNITNLIGLDNIEKAKGVWLQNNNIESLQGLNSLKEIEERLYINNTSITSLEGLDKLESVGEDIEIQNCENLISLEGVPNLSSIDDNFEIYGCRNLPNFQGLPLEIALGKGLYISWCDSITSLVGLESINGDIEDLELYNNGNLTSLNGLENVTISMDVTIQFNDKLLSLDGIILRDTVDDISINSNDALTDISGLSGPIFMDGLDLSSNDNLLSFRGLETVKIIDNFSVSSNDKLIDFQGLDSLKLIGLLNVELHDELNSFHGLENVDTIYQLRVRKNHKLLNMEGLSSLRSIPEGLTITSNDGLLSLDGLEEVAFIESIGLTGNDALKNIDGFQNVTAVAGPIYVQSHDSLTNISGLSNIDPLTISQEDTNVSNFDITIRNNPLLSECSIVSVCNKISQEGALIRIEENATGCFSEEEVTDGCEAIPGLTGYVYEDVNNNGLYDQGDLPVANCKVSLGLGAMLTAIDYTNSEGYYRIFSTAGTYPLQYGTEDRCYDPMLVDTMVTLNDSVLTVQDYPYTRSNVDDVLSEEGFDIYLARAATRCGFTVRHYVSIVNNTCLDGNGNILYFVDGLVDSVFNISDPEATFSNQMISIPVEETLLPGQRFEFTFDAVMPGPEAINSYLNDSIVMNYNFEEYPELDGTNSQIFTSEIRCAYDPNDKLAQPDRSNEYEKSYVLDEAIMYTIRFQNTGNDTAFTVRLEDNISELLDFNSIKPVQASHEYQLKLDADSRLLTVLFEDILLPDSTTNLIGSNGFFSFTIIPVSGLSDFTVIDNFADIYFDFNPPIRTNTFELTYVHDLDILINTEDVLSSQVKIYPNPTSDKIRIRDFGYYEYQIVNLHGQVIQKGKEVSAIDVSLLTTSLYMILFKDEEGYEIGRAKMIKE